MKNKCKKLSNNSQECSGKVPVLIHEGRTIYESVITCDYIDEVLPGIKLNPSAPGEGCMHPLYSL